MSVIAMCSMRKGRTQHVESVYEASQSSRLLREWEVNMTSMQPARLMKAQVFMASSTSLSTASLGPSWSHTANANQAIRLNDSLAERRRSQQLLHKSQHASVDTQVQDGVRCPQGAGLTGNHGHHHHHTHDALAAANQAVNA